MTRMVGKEEADEFACHPLDDWVPGFHSRPPPGTTVKGKPVISAEIAGICRCQGESVTGTLAASIETGY